MLSARLLSPHASDSEAYDSDLDLEDYVVKQRHPTSWLTIVALGLKNALHQLFLRTVFLFRYICLSHHPRSGNKKRKCSFFKDLAKVLVKTAGVFVVVSILNGIFRPSYSNPPPHYEALEKRILQSTVPGRGNPHNEKIFIAANIINEDLIKESWESNLLQLVDMLGPDNVFVSIYENDSGPGTRDALASLRERLPCNSSVIAGDHISLSDFPLVTLPDGTTRTKRITYLAEIRNRLLLPLESPEKTEQWAQQHPSFNHASGEFDRILFLNDVIFTPISAAQLLFSTNQNPATGRAEYASACAIDFVGKVIMYDSFVVRDTEGNEISSMVYPWFTTTGSATTRNDVLAQKDAVRVRSCWGGMAAFNPSIFQSHTLASAGSEQNSSTTLPAIRFRSTPEPFWEAAECCLIFADLEVRNSLLLESGGLATQDFGVFINPYVRVAYERKTWGWMPVTQRYERSWQFIQFWISVTAKSFYTNPRRTHAPGALVTENVWAPSTMDESGSLTNGKFELMTRLAEPGGWCGQRKLFVMKQDIHEANWKGKGKNWEKIKIPPGA